jgi:hypothetical protein
MYTQNNGYGAFAPFILSIFKTVRITEKGVLGPKCNQFLWTAFV